MNKLTLLLSLTAVTLLSAEGTKTQDMSSNEMIKQNIKIVKLASEEISKSLPQKIDKFTTLQRVEGKNTKLIYIYEINTGAKSDETIQQEDRTRMEKVITHGICKSSKRFLDAQIDISYLYISATTKVELFKFDVSQKDCPVER